MERVAISGDVTVFLDALGDPAEHPEALGTAIGLVGPGLEIETFERESEPSEHWYFRRTGAGFLLQSGQVRAIVLPIVRDSGPTYDAVDSLVDGVDLTASRAAIVSALGEPTRSSQWMDLYRLDGRYLRLDFADDRLTDVTTASSDAEVP